MSVLVACKSCRRQYDVGAMKPGEQVRCACGKPIVVPREQPRAARILHCASCGGDLGEMSRKCRYCGSEVTAKERDMGPACPICFARLSANARFCSECGVGINPEAMRTTKIDVKCPRCKGDLVIRELESMLLTDCTGCGGLWLDAQAFEKLVQEKDTKRLASAAVHPGPPATARLETKGYLECLVCKKLMQRKNFAGCSGVIIDWCIGHGFWFDAHELEQIVQFIEKGGMDKARRLAPQTPRPRPLYGPRDRAAPTPIGADIPTAPQDNWN